ncbi:hypothetical protein EB796_000988 [Bugula neritina]|uniref:Uncharacterized protein n=1 Tax=Bugula neritina TaxID=10212 RepID=A0A7J7KR90_BUGNE|nr:hypothetical protein EB796_000988 [Bugula neritina]
MYFFAGQLPVSLCILWLVDIGLATATLGETVSVDPHFSDYCKHKNHDVLKINGEYPTYSKLVEQLY